MSANISIPRNTKAANLAWGRAFVNGIESDPGRFMIDAATAAALRTLVDAYAEQFNTAGVVNRLANNPGGYTKPNRSALSDAAQQFTAMASQVAAQIRVNNGISDADKLAIGVQPVNFTRTPVPAPSSPPVLKVTMAINGAHQIEFADLNTPASRAKPFGVVQIQLLSDIHAANAAADFARARLAGQFTRSPMVVTHLSADKGKTATYWGRWVTRTALAGPYSAAASATVMFAE